MNQKLLLSFFSALIIALLLFLGMHFLGPGLIEKQQKGIEGNGGRSPGGRVDPGGGTIDTGSWREGSDGGAGSGGYVSEKGPVSMGPSNGLPENGRDGASPTTSEGSRDTDGENSRNMNSLKGGADSLKPFEETGESVLIVDVLDEQGEVYPEASVLLSASYGELRDVTDDAGRVVFARLPSGRYTLSVDSADGFNGRSKPIKLNSNSERKITLHVSSGEHLLSGRALDTEGGTLPGVAVQLKPAPVQGDVAYLWQYKESVLTTETDAEGYYFFEGLPSGTFTLSARWRETGERKRRNVSPPSKDEDLVFHVPFEMVVYGTCLDPDGMPVEDATVSVLGRNMVTSRTDVNGEYRLVTKSLSWSDTIYMRARKNGYKRSDERVSLSGDREKEKREIRVDFVLEPNRGSGEITGFLVNEQGEAVPNETILLVSSSNRIQKHARSTSDGSFRFQDLEAGDDYRLSVFPDRLYKDLRKTGLVLEEGGRLEVELVLEQVDVGIIAGVLYDAGRRPLKGYSFRIRSNKSWSNDITVVTASDGSFRKEDVPAGDLIFDTQASPHYSVRGVELEAGEEKRVDIVFGIGSGGIEGAVRGPQDDPVPGGRVVLSWIRKKGGVTSTVQHSTVTDRTGWFRFTDLAAGTYRVQVQAGGYKTIHEKKNLSGPEAVQTWDFTLEK